MVQVKICDDCRNKYSQLFGWCPLHKSLQDGGKALLDAISAFAPSECNINTKISLINTIHNLEFTCEHFGRKEA